MTAANRDGSGPEPPRWHGVLGPVRTARSIFWLRTICTLAGWVLVFFAFYVWYAFESTRGRYTQLAQTPAERLGFEGALTNPTSVALVLFVLGLGLLVGSIVLGTLGDRVRGFYLD